MGAATDLVAEGTRLELINQPIKTLGGYLDKTWPVFESFWIYLFLQVK